MPEWLLDIYQEIHILVLFVNFWIILLLAAIYLSMLSLGLGIALIGEALSVTYTEIAVRHSTTRLER